MEKRHSVEHQPAHHRLGVAVSGEVHAAIPARHRLRQCDELSRPSDIEHFTQLSNPRIKKLRQDLVVGGASIF
jgi:hypothetical protein